MSQKTTPTLLLLAIVLRCIANAYASTVLFNQAFQGRAFGSLSSDDISKRIAVAKDGSVYLAGVTRSHDEDHDAWGDAEPGELTGETDIFIVKLSPFGDLLWVKRTGSAKNDTLNDFKLTNNALYLCGSTDGDFGRPLNGSTDAFVMKFSLKGEKEWADPFQFGSAGEDVCKAIDVDEHGRIYVAGVTSGPLFGNAKPEPHTLHHFVARLDDSQDSPEGVRISIGRQRGAHGNSSADQISVVGDLVFIATSTRNVRSSQDERYATYLNVMDRDALYLHKLHLLRTPTGAGFRGLRMVASNSSGNAYIVGVTTLDDMRKAYTLLKFNPSLKDGNGSVEWETRLGFVSMPLGMHNLKGIIGSKENDDEAFTLNHQLPSVAVDEEFESVFVAGTEEGYYKDTISSAEGVVVVPFFKINSTNGEIIERWQRTTSVPQDRQELTDIALGRSRTVVYTGAWWVGSQPQSSALIGSFGSTVRSIRPEEQFLRTDANLERNPELPGIEKVEDSIKGKWLTVGLVVGSVGIIGAALLVFNFKIKGSKTEEQETESPDSSFVALRTHPSRSHQSVRLSESSGDDLIIGGSSAPQ